jgi:hypothetical protein
MIVRLGKKLCREKTLCMTPLRLSHPALSIQPNWLPADC